MSAIPSTPKDSAETIKTILVPTGGTDTDFIIFETALAVAQPFSAHLEFFHVRVDAAEALRYLPHARFARGLGLRNVLDDIEHETEARSRGAKQHFEDFCKRHKLEVSDRPNELQSVTASWHEEPSHEEEPFVERARTHDLVIMARATRPNGLPPDLLRSLVFGSGRPILIASPEKSPNLGGTIMICWKHAAEPTRAISAAMPLLTKAKRVIIATVEENRASANIADVADYLRWHDVQAETETVKANGQSIPILLSSLAKDCGADLLVMGAYGKNPARESIFGGCTQAILQHADVPVFVFH